MALKASGAESDDVAGTDLVELLDGGVGHVGVDEGAEGAHADREEGVGEGGEQVEDEGVRGAVADGGVLLGVGSFGNAEAEAFVGVFELVLAGTRGGRFMALFEAYVCGVFGVETGGNDGLGVVHEEDVDVF